MTSTTLPINQICISPFNVRKSVPSPDNTAPIEASILVEGLRIPIDVHLMRGSKKMHGAFAGRRRFYALKRLIERGALPADWPVPIVLHTGLSDAELIEKSITENLLRQEMNVPELVAGVALAAAKGHGVEQIARNLGQHNVREVARWLRLGRLAKPVFAAFASGELEPKQAEAFAATEDQELQLAVFEQLRHGPMTPANIQSAMKIGDQQLRRHLSFVGEAIYRAAGGRYELDLFAGDALDRGRIVDEGVLARLVEEKLATVRDQVRVQTRRRELRFIPHPPQIHGYDDHHLAVTPKKRGENLELPDNDDIVAHIAIEAGGEPLVSYWWESRRAKFGSEKPAAGQSVSAANSVPRRAAAGAATTDPHVERPPSDAVVREDDGLSADGVQILRSLRKAVVRGALLADARAGGCVALDYLAWSQARAIFGGYPSTKLGITRLPGENTVGMSGVFDTIREFIAASPAGDSLRAGIEELRTHPSMTGDDLAAGFLAFRVAPAALRNVAAAIGAGQALERSLNADHHRMPIHDALMAEAGAVDDAEVRRHWAPTREFLELFPKGKRQAFGEEVVPEAIRRTWPKLKSADLSDAVLRALPAEWVHPLLHFDAAAGRAAAEQPELAEAAA